MSLGDILAFLTKHRLRLEEVPVSLAHRDGLRIVGDKSGREVDLRDYPEIAPVPWFWSDVIGRRGSLLSSFDPDERAAIDAAAFAALGYVDTHPGADLMSIQIPVGREGEQPGQPIPWCGWHVVTALAEMEVSGRVKWLGIEGKRCYFPAGWVRVVDVHGRSEMKDPGPPLPLVDMTDYRVPFGSLLDADNVPA